MHGNPTMKVRIAMVAGETSGDLLASHLIRALRRICPTPSSSASAGPRCRPKASTCAGRASCSRCMATSTRSSATASSPASAASCSRRSASERPDAFIGVDAPDFNLWLEASARRRHPGDPLRQPVDLGLARRADQAHRALGVAHAVPVPLRARALRARRGAGELRRPPAGRRLPARPDRAETRERLQHPGRAPVVAMLPGSRQSEVRNLADTYIATAPLLMNAIPERASWCRWPRARPACSSRRPCAATRPPSCRSACCSATPSRR
jgi:lipid-A-disaccharide synthase